VKITGNETTKCLLVQSNVTSGEDVFRPVSE